MSEFAVLKNMAFHELFFFFHSFIPSMNSIDSKFRSLNRLTAECQRHIERLDRVDSLTLQKEVSDLIKSDLRSLEQEIAVRVKEMNSAHFSFFTESQVNSRRRR